VFVDALAAATDRVGLAGKTPALIAAAEFSERQLEAMRLGVARRFGEPSSEMPVDVGVLGSYGRGEASPASDLDYVVLLHGAPPRGLTMRDYLLAVEDAADELSISAPATNGMFARVLAAGELAGRVRAVEDSSALSSRRMLYLMESVSIYQPVLHRELRRSIVAEYLAHTAGKRGIPRFLLNDVLRYWRTVGVDYEAKLWSSAAPEWGLRYLKFAISRKLTVAGTVAALLQCDDIDPEEYLDRQFELPPIARLCQLADDARPECRAALRDIVLIAEQLAAFLASPNSRKVAQGIESMSDASRDPLFNGLRRSARDLQAALEIVFFDSSIGPLARRHLSF
jgi:hypothetical protein